MESLSYWLSMAGTVAFATTGVLAVAPKEVDLFSVAVLGVITAIGGGTVRDLILDVPVFWAADLNYIWVALATSVTVFAAHSFFTRKEIRSLMLYVDGLGAAVFGINTTQKVWGLNFGLPLAPVILGVFTAIGGGLIRDVLAGQRTLLMTRELYATLVLFGCALYAVVLGLFPDYQLTGCVGSCLFTFGLRAAAIHWKLSAPEWLTIKAKKE